jgi:dipeptidase D
MHVSLEGAYSGWQPNPSSRLVDIMVQIYERLFGNRPVVGACHAGLECGIIGAKYPDMDMVSFGPTQLAIHTPDERVNIQTVQKFYSFILEILKNIPEE